MFFKRNEHGRSIIEILGYIALAMMIVAASMRLYNQARARAKQSELQMRLDDISRRISDIWLGRNFQEDPNAKSIPSAPLTIGELGNRSVDVRSPFGGEFMVGGLGGNEFFYVGIGGKTMSVPECIEAVANNHRRAYCVVANTSDTPTSSIADGDKLKQEKTKKTGSLCDLNLSTFAIACQKQENLFFFYKKN